MKLCSKKVTLLLAVAMVAICHQAYAGTESSAKPKQVPISGKVVESMDGGGYTYVLLKNGSDKMWVAAPLMKVTVGQELKLVPGYEMKDFTSRGLNRKFDRIIFSAGVANSEIKLPASAIKMAHEGMAAAPAAEAKAKADAKQEKPAAAATGKVQKAKGANAYTIAQLYAKKAKLEKKPVVVRGRVVKISEHIMKRNWIHIEDGTGSKGKKTNDLAVTSKDLPKIGDVVTVKGTLYNNMDFGSGYRYDVLIEGARLN